MRVGLLGWTALITLDVLVVIVSTLVYGWWVSGQRPWMVLVDPGFVPVLASLAAAALIPAIPYGVFVGRSPRGVVRRGSIGGAGYGIGVVICGAVIAWIEGQSHGISTSLSAYVFGFLVLFGWIAVPLGVVFGAVYGVLVERLGRPSTNPPIVD